MNIQLGPPPAVAAAGPVPMAVEATAGSFVSTLSVPGREHQHQTGIQVTVTPLSPWPSPAATPVAALPPREGDDADARTARKHALHITPATFEPGGMTVVGFWEPGRG
eukprot:CAMPEP_0181386608 /NCGR_PEP_ID=MMETSP1106-20121128/23237_1 /TAXON_ID=81844 /ORGANISM="Mantoniella antarctica, Strain SL-175" /LENGTH=107 /DNA_ID=CAMNT_0023506853 /DNA_START=164 /DNA_END=483 /DNA_ORIENTATION=-